MTIEEIITALQNHCDEQSGCSGCKLENFDWCQFSDLDDKTLLDMYNRVCNEYEAKPSTDSITEAAEKQIGKAVKRTDIGSGITLPLCPVCGQLLLLDMKYCHQCGQKIDWGDGHE